MGKREITYHHNFFKIKKNKTALKVSPGSSLEILHNPRKLCRFGIQNPALINFKKKIIIRVQRNSFLQLAIHAS